MSFKLLPPQKNKKNYFSIQNTGHSYDIFNIASMIAFLHIKKNQINIYISKLENAFYGEITQNFIVKWYSSYIFS